MRRLLLLCLVCVFGACGDADTEDSGGETGAISFSWKLEDRDQPVSLQCAPGEQVRVGVNGQSETFSCDGDPAIITGISVGQHTATHRLLDESGEIMASAAMPVTAFKDQTNPALTATLLVVGGDAPISWGELDASDGCYVSGTVVLDFTGITNDHTAQHTAACRVPGATITGLPRGTYSVTVTLRDGTTDMGSMSSQITVPSGGVASELQVVF